MYNKTQVVSQYRQFLNTGKNFRGFHKYMKIKTQKRKPEAVFFFLGACLQLSGHFLVCLLLVVFKEKKNVDPCATLVFMAEL